MNNVEIQSILESIGERVPPSSQIILIDGSALALLGSPRPTLDIDFFGDDVHPTDLHKIIMQAAKELQIYVEPVLCPCQQTAQSVISELVSLAIWKSLLPTRTALPLAN